jgi:hypothetical protein
MQTSLFSFLAVDRWEQCIICFGIFFQRCIRLRLTLVFVRIADSAVSDLEARLAKLK